jgi:hypothetical protein
MKWGKYGIPDSLGSGQKTISVAGTAEAIVGSSTECVSVTIKALAGNTGNVYVGKSTVNSSNGLVLAAGDSVSFDIDNLNRVYIDVDTNGEGISFLYVG